MKAEKNITGYPFIKMVFGPRIKSHTDLSGGGI